MKFRYITLFAAVLCLTACNGNTKNNHEAEISHEANDSDAHEPHDGLIELSDNEAKRFKVRCSVALPAKVAESTKLPATFVSSNTSVTIVSAAKSGRLTWLGGIQEGSSVGVGRALGKVESSAVTGGDTDAADKVRLSALEAEIKRVKPLVEDGIVSRKDYNSLLAEADQLRKLTQTASGASTVMSHVQGVVTRIIAGNGSYVNAGDPVAEVQSTSNAGVMLRVDVPQRLLPRIGEIVFANVAAADGTSTRIPRATRASAADATGFMPVYFGPVAADLGIVPGSVVEASVEFNNGKDASIALPVESINEQEGAYTVFVKTKPGHYRRVPVTIGVADDEVVEILSGISPTDSVVTSGGIYLRLAETRANAPQGHTHNH